MKFLHTSDLHIGKRVNGMSMLDDQCFILDQIVTIARDNDVDAILVAGDIYDKASPSAEAVTVLDDFLTKLAGLGIRVLAVPGNHDSAERIAYAQELLSRQGVCFPPVFDGHIESAVLRDDYGDVVVWLLPFLKPGDVRRFFPDEEIGDDYAAAIRAVLRGCAIDPGKRNVVVSHQLVTAAGVAPDRADDEIKLGGIDNVDVSVFGAFDYVALGHVHRPQRVGRDTVRYSGSPLKYSFSEARFDKSVVLVELGEKKAGDNAGACVRFELIPLIPVHDMREVRMTLSELLALGAQGSVFAPAESGQDCDSGDAAGLGEASDLDAASGSVETSGLAAGVGSAQVRDPLQDYLHVTLTDEHPQIDAMARVHELFPNAMTLDYDNAALLAAREKVRTAVDPDEIDTVELFAKFYEEQAGKPMDEAQNDIVARFAHEVEQAFAQGGSNAGGGTR